MSVSAAVKHKLTLGEYHTLVLPPTARVELIDGELYDMAPIGSAHADIVEYLGDLLHDALPKEYKVRRQNPITLKPHSEPLPDLCVAKPRDLPYRKAHPNPEDIALIIEVADSSLVYDKGQKLPLYARYGIPEVWIIDLVHQQISVYTLPINEAYTKMRKLSPPEVVSPEFYRAPNVSLTDVFAEL